MAHFLNNIKSELLSRDTTLVLLEALEAEVEACVDALAVQAGIVVGNRVYADCRGKTGIRLIEITDICDPDQFRYDPPYEVHGLIVNKDGRTGRMEVCGVRVISHEEARR